MARKRLIAPQFFLHADLFDAEKSSGLPLRIAYAGLWCQADRRGCFAWKPRELKLCILPYESVDMSDVLEALRSHGFIQRYEAEGRSYGHVPTLHRGQTYNINEKQNFEIPNPPALDGATPKKPAPKPVRSGKKSTTPKSAGESKYPDFPSSVRKELYEYWRQHVGNVAFAHFIGAIGSFCTASNLPNFCMAVRDYAGTIMRGKSSPYASPADLAKRLGALMANVEANRDDPIKRVEGAHVIVHGSTPRN